MVSKFPTTINTDDKINAVHNAMPSILEETFLAEPFAFAQSEHEYEYETGVAQSAVLFIF